MNTTTPVPSARNAYRFLDVLVVQVDLITGDDGTVVAEAVLPEGASPPAHVHADLDDSFYLLEGRMVVRCGADESLIGPGAWVQLPAGVPHTFRVLDGPARVLMVHRDDSFLAFVREVGQRVDALGEVAITRSVAPVDLVAVMARHGMIVVGDAIEEPEARALEAALAG